MTQPTETPPEGADISFDELMEETVRVEFEFNFKPRTVTLVAPTVKEVQALRKRHMDWLAENDARNDEAMDKGKSQLAPSFNWLVGLEDQAVHWLRATLPSAKKKTDGEILAFIHKVHGGVHSPLLTTARRLCGLLLAERGGTQTPF